LTRCGIFRYRSRNRNAGADLKRFAVVILAFHALVSRADFPAMLLLPALFGDIHVGASRGIRDQAGNPYCTLHALATYLELWFNSRYPTAPKTPALSPAFLAMAYNAEYASGAGGTMEPYLLSAVAKYGVVTSDAWEITPFPKVAASLKTEWAKAHRKLIPKTEVESILEMPYWNPEFSAWYRPSNYFNGRFKFDFKKMKQMFSRRAETFVPEVSSPGSSGVEYRETKPDKREAWETKAKARAGLAEGKYLNADKLYLEILKHLYRPEPVFVSVNPALVKRAFSLQSLLSNPDLVEPGQGRPSYHSMVAVGVCDEAMNIPACEPFESQFKKKGITECLLLQNSWGEDAHQKGYVCLSPAASQRMINSAYLRDL